MPRGDHRQAHNEAHQRHQHGKAPGVGHAALNFAAADGFADHDDAGVAETDIEREGQLGKRLEDGHARVIFIAHVGINAVEHEHTERPQAFVRHDGQCAGAELAELLQVKVKQLPHRADQQVFLKRREDQNQHRPQPGRNARCDGRALYAEPRQAERAEDQAIVRKGVGDGRDDRDIERQADALCTAQDVRQQIRQRDGRIGEADDAQIPAAGFHDGGVLIEQAQHPCGRRQRDGQKAERNEHRQHQADAHHAPDALEVLDAPILRDKHAHARAQAKAQKPAKPAPLGRHANGGERHVAQLRHHQCVDQLERACQYVLQRDWNRQLHGHAPEGLIAQIISQFHKK